MIQHNCAVCLHENDLVGINPAETIVRGTYVCYRVSHIEIALAWADSTRVEIRDG